MSRLIFFVRQEKGIAWRARTMAKNTTKIKELKTMKLVLSWQGSPMQASIEGVD
jgi:hypothetical protein